MSKHIAELMESLQWLSTTVSIQICLMEYFSEIFFGK